MGTYLHRQLDKVRVIALYILFRDGVADEDRRRLFQHARLSITEQDSVNNLVHLGAKVIKVSGSPVARCAVCSGPCAETYRTPRTGRKALGSSRSIRRPKGSTSCHGTSPSRR
jgi:hypothetical protein